MPKMKTSKAAAKRFRVSASGRVKRGRSGTSHNTGKRSAAWKRKMRAMQLIPETGKSMIQRMLPHAGIK